MGFVLAHKDFGDIQMRNFIKEMLATIGLIFSGLSIAFLVAWTIEFMNPLSVIWLMFVPMFLALVLFICNKNYRLFSFFILWSCIPIPFILYPTGNNRIESAIFFGLFTSLTSWVTAEWFNSSQCCCKSIEEHTNRNS